ncbi:MAG: hypothetical protein K2J00_08180, partial [Bacteroidaceae bacterium]|nr:hypothetical protein [Bacteroidaceae bacterium]
INIERVSVGEGKVSFGKLIVNALERKLNVSSCKHGKINVTLVNGKSFEGLVINSSYTDVDLFLADRISARYGMKTKFGGIEIDSPVHSTHRQEGGVKNSFISSDSGYIGKDPAAKTLIEIQAGHGGIKMSNR